MRSQMRRTLVMAAPQPLARCCFREFNKLNTAPAPSRPRSRVGGAGSPFCAAGTPFFTVAGGQNRREERVFFANLGVWPRREGELGGSPAAAPGPGWAPGAGRILKTVRKPCRMIPGMIPGIAQKPPRGGRLGASGTRQKAPNFGQFGQKGTGFATPSWGVTRNGVGFATHKIRRDPKSMRHPNGQFRPP
jgi:hypothetical protein